MRKHIRFPGNRIKALTLSYDDGVETDYRLIEIMQKNGLKGTFNINSGGLSPEGTVFPAGQAQRVMCESRLVQCYTGSGMEVATHGYTHPYLDRLSPEMCTFEVMADRAKLETLFGGTVRGHAYPFGTYNDTVLDVLRKCGIVYARTCKSTEGFSLPKDPLILNPTCHHDNPRLMDLLDSFLNRKNSTDPLLFYLWGHSYEFDGDNTWNVIENFCAKAGGHDDVWYATNIEIIDYVRACESLITSADGRTLYNPTNTDVAFFFGGSGVRDEGTREIKAGQTIHID